MSNNSPQNLPAWKDLQAHAVALSNTKINDLFSGSGNRFDAFHLSSNSALYDYSKQRITDETLLLLNQLAEQSGLSDKLAQMQKGAYLNHTENRAVLHTALRASPPPSIEIENENIGEFITNLHAQIQTISNDIRNDNTITDVLHIGIGGSDLGPRLVCEAFTPSYQTGPNVHFLNNIDGYTIRATLGKLNPQSTKIIIASKTFTTLETSAIAKSVKKWMEQSIAASDMGDHFYAVTAATHQAIKFGIPEKHILPMRDWIGGRFSVWSAIGLPIAITFGFDTFSDFIKGARMVDQDMATKPLKENIAYKMAMIGIWNRNFLNYNSLAILPYCDALNLFTPYLQQLDMESNGKAAPIKTSPIIFGGVGTGAQHAFMQAFHQGTDITPCEFIIVSQKTAPDKALQATLSANAIAQAQALMVGQTNTENPHEHFEGNRPSSCLVLKEFTPYSLGQLMALYEYKICIQGFIWGINSFDQWGVTLGKTLASNLQNTIENNSNPDEIDSSTQALIHAILEK